MRSLQDHQVGDGLSAVLVARIGGGARRVVFGVPRVEFETHGRIASAVVKFTAKTPSIYPEMPLPEMQCAELLFIRLLMLCPTGC